MLRLCRTECTLFLFALVFDQFLTYKLFLTLALLFDTYVVDR